MGIFLKNSHNIPPILWGSPADILYAVKCNCENIYEIPYEKLVFASPIQEKSGNVVNDYSGDNNHATSYGTRVTNGIDLVPGSSQYIDCGNSSSLRPTTGISFLIDLHLDANPTNGNFMGVGGVWDTGANKRCWAYYISQEVGHLYHYLSVDNGAGNYADKTVGRHEIDLSGQRYTYIGTYNGSVSGIKLYINGESKTVNYYGNDGGNINSEDQECLIGAQENSGTPFRFLDGKVYRALLFSNYVLSQAQVDLFTELPHGLYQKVLRPFRLFMPTVSINGIIDVASSSQVTIPSVTARKPLNVNNVECLSEITAGAVNIFGEINVNNNNCNTEVTAAELYISRDVNANNIESFTEIGTPILESFLPLDAQDVSSLTEVTATGIYKELSPPDIECSSAVDGATAEWIMIGRMNVTLPMITAEITGGHGGFLNVELPMITAEMRGGAQLNVTLPMIMAEITGSVGIKADLNVTLPMIKAEMTGTVEVLGQLNVTLPMITARMSGTAGQVGQLNVTLPMITAQLTGYTDIDGQLNVTLPMIEARLIGTNDRFADCDPLRYTEPELE